MTNWHQFSCENPNCNHALGLTNDVAVIVGGTYIEQRKINILCQKCSRLKKFSSATPRHIVKFLTAAEIAALTGSQ